jgi:hypothetical protein
MIRCAGLLLAHLGEDEAATRLEDAADVAVEAVLAGRLRANTAAQRDAVLSAL